MKISFNKPQIRPDVLERIYHNKCLICGQHIFKNWKRLGTLLELGLITQLESDRRGNWWTSFLCYNHSNLTDQEIIDQIV